MNWIVFHIVSGDAFFTGIALLIAASLSSLSSRTVVARASAPLFLIGAAAVVLSSTPIPLWYCIAWLITLVGWFVSWFVKSWRLWAVRVFVIACCVADLIEFPYRFSPTMSPVSTRSVSIIGDSVTAGVDRDEKSETWPKLLARQHHVKVQDISHMGDTAASALKRVLNSGSLSSIIVVEIGGNDVLGSTSPAQFRKDLDALLTTLQSPDRQIVMFELPLPPFYHEYGSVQRSLALRHGVKLIPKRRFLSIIAGGESTLDSIHLSQSGHQQMADCVWDIVQTAFAGNATH
jgi:acyl-CoA thioesterase-1